MFTNTFDKMLTFFMRTQACLCCRIDDIEDEIYREKLKIKKVSDELNETFDDMLENYWFKHDLDILKMADFAKICLRMYDNFSITLYFKSFVKCWNCWFVLEQIRRSEFYGVVPQITRKKMQIKWKIKKKNQLVYVYLIQFYTYQNE